jgi:hypothetical protein
MKTFIKGTLLSLWSIVGLLFSAQAQEFSKLIPKQIGDKITLEYAIAGEAVGQQFTISPFYSADGGKSFLPLKSVKGNVGSNIPGGRNQIIVWDVLKDLKELDSDVIFKLEGVSRSIVPLQDDFRDVVFKLESLNRTPDGNVELVLSITNNGPTRDLKMINGLITITDFSKRKYDAQRGNIAEVEGNERYSTPQRTIKKGEKVKARFLFERVPAEVDRAMRLDLGVELITDETYGIDLKIGKLQFRDLPITSVQTAGMRVEQTKKLQIASSPEHFTVRKIEVADTKPPVIELITPANIPLVGNEATRGRPYAQSSIGMDDKRLRSLSTGEELATTDEFTMVEAKIYDESGIYDVTVNGISAEPSTNGVFQVKVPLEIGRNEIVIRAVDLRQNSIEKKFFILRKAPSGKVTKGDTEELDIVFDSPKTHPVILP